MPIAPLASSTRRFAGILLLSLALAACATTTTNQAGSEEESPRIDITALHPLARTIAQAGAPECAMKVHEAAIYLTIDTAAGALVHTNSRDLHTFSLEILDSDGLTSFVSLNIAPSAANACAISYEVVTLVPLACDAIISEGLVGAIVGDPVREHIMHYAFEGGPHVFLQPFGDACLMIRKEIFP